MNRLLPDGRRRRLLCLPVLLLAACAAPAPERLHDAVFRRGGRFSLSVTPVDGQQDAVQGSFLWADDGTRLQLDLLDPMGSTLARVAVDQAGAVLWHADGRREDAPDPDSLVARVLGSAIPVSALRDWLQGRLGAGQAQDVEHDAAQRPTAFVQDGWRVGLSRYDDLGPGVLQLDRHDAQASIRVRLAITAPA